jgi:hypothetical protein
MGIAESEYMREADKSNDGASKLPGNSEAGDDGVETSAAEGIAPGPDRLSIMEGTVAGLPSSKLCR